MDRLETEGCETASELCDVKETCTLTGGSERWLHTARGAARVFFCLRRYLYYRGRLPRSFPLSISHNRLFHSVGGQNYDSETSEGKLARGNYAGGKLHRTPRWSVSIQVN